MCIKENERKSENRWAFCIDINVMISFFKKEHHARVMFTSQTFFVVVNFVVLHPLKKNFVEISRRKFKSNHIWLSYVFVIVLKTIFSIFIILLLFNTNIYLRVFVITLYSHGLSKVVFFSRRTIGNTSTLLHYAECHRYGQKARCLPSLLEKMEHEVCQILQEVTIFFIRCLRAIERENGKCVTKVLGISNENLHG